jgi:hypothetical protein
MAQSHEERFIRFVNKVSTGCWRWTGSIDKDGYANFTAKVDGEWKRVRAFRWAYQHWIGLIPDGLTLDHVKERGCVFRDCVNPDHGEPVTALENRRRSNHYNMLGHCRCGEPFDRVDANDKQFHSVCRAAQQRRYRTRKVGA